VPPCEPHSRISIFHFYLTRSSLSPLFYPFDYDASQAFVTDIKARVSHILPCLVAEESVSYEFDHDVSEQD
jgi:hypothetical protein